MAANTFPIASRTGSFQWGATALATANTAKDGTGTVLTVFTADATNGGYAKKLRACPSGTAVASVLRIFVNNGSTNATPANNILIGELSLPAITLTEVASQIPLEFPLDIVLPAGYKIICTVGTTVAAGYYVSCEGGAY